MYKLIESSHKQWDEYLQRFQEIDGKYWINRKTSSLVEDYSYFAVEINHKLVGYAIIEDRKDEYFIERVFIDEDRRYESLGTKLIKHIFFTALRHKKDTLRISAGDGSLERFFVKNYFELIGDEFVLQNIQKQNERSKEGIRGTWVSIIINVLLSFLKIVVGIVGKSRALIADGLHSVSDVVSSIVILFSVHFGSVPEDEDHPYGHEKIECIAGNIVGVILVLTAFELSRNSIANLMSKGELVTPSIITVFAAGISIVVKFWLYSYKIKIGRKTNNDAILADAREHRSDAISSVGVIIGLFLSIYVNPIFDTLLGILVSLFIGKEGISIILDTSNTLLDRQDKDFIEEIEGYVRDNGSVGNIHDTLMRVSGDKIFLSFHIRLPKEMTVYEAHMVADELKYSLESDYERLRDVTIHIDYIH